MEVKIITHMIEYAPAVAILLLLHWQNARQMAKFWDACLKHLIEDAKEHDHETSNPK